MQHILKKVFELRSTSRQSNTQFAGKFVVLKGEKSYDTFNSVGECVYGRNRNCKAEYFCMCFQGKNFHHSGLNLQRCFLLEQAH